MTSFDGFSNFAYGTVSTPPSPATTGTTLVLQTNEGDSFADPSVDNYNAIVWDGNDNFPTVDNSEIVRVTGKSGDTFTITREQESTTARTIVANDKFIGGITLKTINDIFGAINALETMLDPSTNTVTADTIQEDTSGNGVDIDSLKIKDGAPIWDGWIPLGYTLTYASATSATITGVDLTSIFTPGTKITLTQSTGGQKFWYVLSSSYSSDTTINFIETGDYTLVNEAITSPKYSLIERPVGFPRSFDYSTIVTIATNTSMTFTSVTIAIAEYSISGGIFVYELNVLGTTGGTLSNSIYASVPITPAPNTNALLGGGATVFDSSNEAGFYTYSTSSGNNLLFRRTAAGNFTAGAGRGFKATAKYLI